MQTFKSQGPISPKDQILHQCTTHFVALLDTEISDRLLVQLSRLAMMLPVVGVETRAVIRTKVAEVMQQVVRGLTSYEAVEKVIRTAVDDAGLQLVTMAPSTSPLSSELNPSRDNYNDNNDNKSNSLRREAREDDLFVMNNDFRDDVISEYDGEFDESSSISGETNPVTATITADTIDESQIPVVTDIAMEAVLDYMAEILTPSLVIHQLTEAIQGALQDISQQRKAVLRMRVQHKNNKDEKYLDDLDNEEDVVDLDELSSLAFGRSHGNQDRHGIDLLSDGWVWSGPSSSSSHRDSNNLEGGLTEDGSDGQDGEDEDDSRGSDEDLWDKDMETYPWDSTGRLFDDFEDEDVSSSTPQSALSAASVTEQDMANWDMANALAGDDEEGYDDENFDPYVIGIRETNEGCTPHGTGSDDDGGEDDEEDEYDPMADTSEDYGREQYLQQSYFNRFQKRSFIAPPRPPTVPSKNVPSTPAVNVQSTTRAIRRLNLTPDPRLENLLTQLIEPLLTTFIEDDFPASCKRVQGELMDGIIWSLDQGELRGGHGRDGLDSDEERMLLLSELEY
ncbi:hypothetical protein FBU30_008470 [Linnemannia zychae]|nr:hypothetical protein FBU30_008470 [Linnemannia zychae]